jgi:hypothetical protein
MASELNGMTVAARKVAMNNPAYPSSIHSNVHQYCTFWSWSFKVGGNIKRVLSCAAKSQIFLT